MSYNFKYFSNFSLDSPPINGLYKWVFFMIDHFKPRYLNKKVRQEVSCSNTGPEKKEGEFQKLVLRRPIMATCTCTVGNDRV